MQRVTIFKPTTDVCYLLHAVLVQHNNETCLLYACSVDGIGGIALLIPIDEPLKWEPFRVHTYDTVLDQGKHAFAAFVALRVLLGQGVGRIERRTIAEFGGAHNSGLAETELERYRPLWEHQLAPLRAQLVADLRMEGLSC